MQDRDLLRQVFDTEDIGPVERERRRREPLLELQDRDVGQSGQDEQNGDQQVG